MDLTVRLMDQQPNRDQSMNQNKSDIQYVWIGHYRAAICKWDWLWLISVFTVLAAKFQRDIVFLIDLPKSYFVIIHLCSQRFLARANPPSIETRLYNPPPSQLRTGRQEWNSKKTLTFCFCYRPTNQQTNIAISRVTSPQLKIGYDFRQSD